MNFAFGVCKGSRCLLDFQVPMRHKVVLHVIGHRLLKAKLGAAMSGGLYFGDAGLRKVLVFIPEQLRHFDKFNLRRE